MQRLVAVRVLLCGVILLRRRVSFIVLSFSVGVLHSSSVSVDIGGHRVIPQVSFVEVTQEVGVHAQ